MADWAVAFIAHSQPGFWTTLAPLLIITIALFVRYPTTNYIFDEQEALLANPYVNGVDGLQYKDAIYRDFWGLKPDRSIGSYRPIPNYLWRALWQITDEPFFHHGYNLILHAVVGTLLVLLIYRWTRRPVWAWLSGTTFVCSAVLTEAVSGIVGIADVLGGLAAVLALLTLSWRAPLMAIGVFATVSFGLFSKESALVCVPLVPLAAMVMAPVLHPHKPRRLLRGLLAAIAALGAFILYVELRKRWFDSPLPAHLAEPLPNGTSAIRVAYHDLLVWFHQAPLPRDPLNNPLIDEPFPIRLGGALRVYFRGLVTVVFPWRLSGDYSFPAEPAPETLWFPESLAGAFLMIAPPLAGLGLWLGATLRGRDPSSEGNENYTWLPLAFALVWPVVAYFPHSNIPVVLPTVRAERFWYMPAMFTSVVIAYALIAFYRLAKRHHARAAGAALIVYFLSVQGVQAYRHAMDYRDDLHFWKGTVEAVPNSAKAHLNYSVMKGARRDLDTRLVHSKIALSLAPEWPMANVYLGDTYCRMKRTDEAWPHYQRGFELGPNQIHLIALALQCLYDEGTLKRYERPLRQLAWEHPGTWLSYLATDTLNNGDQHQGVDPQYRPRGYDQGPKKDDADEQDAD